VSIITVNYNQTGLTLALLQSIVAQDFEDVETIVVDNGSKEDPFPAITTQFPQVICVRSATNLGFAGGNNKGIGLAKGRYLFFVNNDTEIPNGCIAQLVGWATANPRCGAVSPMIYYYPASEKRIQYAGMTPISRLTARNATIGEGALDHGQFGQPTLTAYAHGAAMLVPSTVLEKVGTMYEQFFLYYEELDWCARMHRAGYETWVQPQATIVHKESASVGTNSPLKTYFMHRNRLLFMQRNHPNGLLAFYAYMILVATPKNILAFGLKKEWSNARALAQAMAWFFLGVGNRFEKLVPLYK
jgi:GT2 family glycosyltransferase